MASLVCRDASTNESSSPIPRVTDEQLPWPSLSAEAGGGSCSKHCSLEAFKLSFNRWTYSYMNRILTKGSRQRANRLRAAREGKQNVPATELLSETDLYSVPHGMKAPLLSSKFWHFYEAEEGRFLRTLWRLAAPTFVPAGLCQLITVIAQVSIPVIVRELLGVLEKNPYSAVISEGVPYAILLFFASVLNALFNHRHHHLAFQSGVLIRTAVAGAIYEHSLQLSPLGRKGLSTGQITNLVATDTQKLFELMQEGHLVWSCPFAVLMVSILLLVIVGPTALVGIGMLVTTLPIVKFVVSKMIHVRDKRATVADRRIEIITSMLQGIKVTKLNNYEDKYEKRVEEARSEEMAFVRKEQYIWAWTLVIMVSTPVLATAATFTTYVLIDEKNILTPSLTFTTLMLFSALRFPINYAGKLIGKAALGYQAARRISNFLQRQTRQESGMLFEMEGSTTDPSTSTTNSSSETSETASVNEEALLIVKHATFNVGGSSKSKKSKSKKRKKKKKKSKRSTNESTLIMSTTTPSIVRNPKFSVSDISLTVSRSEVLAVVGPVGCGKSSLVKGLIGELRPSSRCGGSVEARGKVAYASQIPFVLNASVRDNILFGAPFDQERYEKVLDSCCLRQDLEQLGAAGDLTEIGERGVTLSGGQKQRVSIARAVYSKPDIIVFDDPLSALDAGTSRLVFEKLFDSRTSPDGLLSSTAVVLVTHAAHFLHRVDRIVVMNAGQTVFYGSWDELMEFETNEEAEIEILSAIRSALKESGDGSFDSEREHGGANAVDISAASSSNEASGGLIAVEDREYGISSYKTWLRWFQYAGGWPFVVIQVIFMAVDRTAYVAIEWWLALWTDAADKPAYAFGIEFPAQTDGYPAQIFYLKVYAILYLIMAVGASLRSRWAVAGGARCAERLFSQMTARVLHAPMSYFETNPLGRILNRFTHDVESLDTTLTQAMTILIIANSWVVAGLTVMISILPWIVSVIVPVIVTYTLVLLHYRKSAADLQRLDLISRSPVQALLSEGLDGAPVIRVFGMIPFFVQKFQAALDSNSSAMLNFISAHRWLALRIELLGAVVTLSACLFVTTLNDKLRLEPGVVGLLIIWTSTFTITLGFLVDSISESEAAMTSIERVHKMSQLPQERSMATDEKYDPGHAWPTCGNLEFRDVRLRYREGLDPSLDGLSFELPHGKRCGVVGRTGAGKSTLTVALFRLVEIEEGSVHLDGVDLSNLGLSDVRGRQQGMYIIPQDPVLFAGSLRECLDPFAVASDDEIIEALTSVRIPGAEKGKAVLEDIVEEGGANYSVGERQLLFLARALLAKPKLLVMDEATASIDGQTDAFIQEMLRNRFQETTLLTVAHRLDTIMDYDLILVMDKGRAVEFGSPSDLLQSASGVFTELVNATGSESAAALTEMAEKAASDDIV